MYFVDPPEAPYDVDIKWTLNNNLTLEWKLPNKTNGNIICFNITLKTINYDNTNTTIHKTVNVQRHLLQYHYEIDGMELMPSSEYEIKISAYNGFNGTEFTVKDTSPPDTPLLDSEPEIDLVHGKILVKLSSTKLLQMNEDTLNIYQLYVLSSKKQQNNRQLYTNNIPNTLEHLPLNLTNFQCVFYCKLKNFKTLHLTIGEDNNIVDNCEKLSNIYVDANSSYNITVVLTKHVKNKTSYKVYYKIVGREEGTDIFNNSCVVLVACLLIITVTLLLSWRILSKKYSNNLVKRHNNKRKRIIDIGAEENLVCETKLPSLHESGQHVTRAQTNDFVNEKTGNEELQKNKTKPMYNTGQSSTEVYSTPSAYITIKIPKSNIFPDFWNIIWTKNVRYIFWLGSINEDKTKIAEYWPDENGNIFYDTLTVKCVSKRLYTCYEHRVLNVIKDGQSRKIEHFYFFLWPDHNLYIYSQELLILLDKIHQLSVSCDLPILLYYSHNLDIIETVLFCDTVLRKADEEKVDLNDSEKIFAKVLAMNNNMELCKLALVTISEYLLKKKEAIPCNVLVEKVEKLSPSDIIKSLMRYFEETKSTEDFIETIVKNTPKGTSTVLDSIKLSRYPSTENIYTYINAVTVDSYTRTNNFIVTHYPVPNTIGCFWGLINVNDISAVIILNKSDVEQVDSCNFLPTVGNPSMTLIPYLNITYQKAIHSRNFDIVNVQLHDRKRNKFQLVEIIKMKLWTAGKACPDEDFLSCFQRSRELSKKCEQVLVTCYDGITASGLYTAMDFVFDQIDCEGVCDVGQAVRTVRRSNINFVQREDQLYFLYKTAADYAKEKLKL